MTTITKRKLTNGDEIEIRTNAGAAPIVFVNGVLQPRGLYKVVFGRDGLPNAVKNEPRRWASWFAWWPVTTISGRRVWWERIYRSRGNTYVDHDDWTWYYYGDDFDVLRDLHE